MLQIWEYETPTGTQRGIFAGFSDFGGNDVPYRFHRLDASGRKIEYLNGGVHLDVVQGSLLKSARRIGTMNAGEAYHDAD